MAINKSRVNRIERYLNNALIQSTAICQSQGLKGKQESNVYMLHSYILKAQGMLKEIKESIDRRELRKAKSKAFDPDKLDPEKL